MSYEQIVRTNGYDYSMVRGIIFVNTSGYSVANPSLKICDTRGGTDFSMVKIIIPVSTSGYPQN